MLTGESTLRMIGVSRFGNFLVKYPEQRAEASPGLGAKFRYQE